EDVNDARVGIDAQLLFDQRRKAVHAFAEVDGLHRDHHANRSGREDHALRIRMIPSTNSVSAPLLIRTVMAPAAISIIAVVPGRRVFALDAAGGVTSTGANTGSSFRTSSPLRAALRQA